MAAQCLDGVGQAVEGVGGDHQAVEQQRVGRHRGVAQPRALHGEQEEHALQRQAADENIAVDHQQRPPTGPGAQARPVRLAGEAPECAAGQCQAEQGAAPFGGHRGLGRAGHAPAQAHHEPQAEHDVDEVGGQQDRQRCAGVLCAEEPADQRVGGQRRRQAEQADVEELPGQRIQFGGRSHQRQRRAGQGHRQQAEQQCQAEGQQQALAENPPQRSAILAPGRLGGETGGAHAQETEHADQQGIEPATDGHGTQLVGVRQVADHRAVDQGDQRHGNVGEDHRRGKRPDAAVGRRMPPGFEQGIHSGLLGRPAV